MHAQQGYIYKTYEKLLQPTLDQLMKKVGQPNGADQPDSIHHFELAKPQRKKAKIDNFALEYLGTCLAFLAIQIQDILFRSKVKTGGFFKSSKQKQEYRVQLNQYVFAFLLSTVNNTPDLKITKLAEVAINHFSS